MKKPKRSKKIDLLVARYINDFRVGSHRSLLHGWGGDFDTIRPWQPGDRRIAIPATARTGNIMAKVFHEPKQMTVWLLVDHSASMAFGCEANRAEAAAVLLTVLGISAARAGDLFGVIVFDSDVVKFVNPTRDETVLKQVGDLMVDSDLLGSETNLEIPLNRLVQTDPKDSLVIIISDFFFFLGTKGINLMKQLASSPGNCLLALILYDKRERELPSHRFIADIRDSEGGGELVWDISSAPLAAKAAQNLAEKQKELISALKQAGSEYLLVDISRNYVRQLAKHFAKKSMYSV